MRNGYVVIEPTTRISARLCNGRVTTTSDPDAYPVNAVVMYDPELSTIISFNGNDRHIIDKTKIFGVVT